MMHRLSREPGHYLSSSLCSVLEEETGKPERSEYKCFDRRRLGTPLRGICALLSWDLYLSLRTAEVQGAVLLEKDWRG